MGGSIAPVATEYYQSFFVFQISTGRSPCESNGDETLRANASGLNRIGSQLFDECPCPFS